MKFNIKSNLSILALSLFLLGCANNKQPINETALFWHNSIYKNIMLLDVDTADDRFTSLEVEHPNSIYIPTDLLILAKAHLYNQEYQLALFYINEYEKRYANRYEKEWCEYQKAKIRFFSITNPYTNQKNIMDTLNFINQVISIYPNSVYKYELNTMKKKLEVTLLIFDNKIASLYKKLDKPKAAEIYKKNINTPVIPPHIPWYKKIFYW